MKRPPALPTFVNCPECRKQGKIVVSQGWQSRRITCPVCDGRGMVGSDRLPAIKHGKLMREERIRAKRSQRQEARLRKIDVRILNAMEWGRYVEKVVTP